MMHRPLVTYVLASLFGGAAGAVSPPLVLAAVPLAIVISWLSTSPWSKA